MRNSLFQIQNQLKQLNNIYFQIIQATFSGKNLSHTRRLYDQLSIMAPLFLAATASSPIFRGKLSAIDTRWDVIAASVDCRTSEERDSSSEKYIPKSRYSSISLFISDEARNLPMYNDTCFPLNREIMEFAKVESGKMNIQIDDALLSHLGFLFIRDPMVLFEQKINVDNSKETLHFENIQSTNWNSVRFKPPPTMDSDIGWRVEFRTMESQITDDENAAFLILSLILVRMFYESDELNFYIPMSKVDENFASAKTMSAVTEQSFYFRVNVFDQGPPKVELLTLHEIFFGKQNIFEGIHSIATNIWDGMLKKIHQSSEDKRIFDSTWKYLEQRLSGERLTVAQWIRNFVQKHPSYKQDSNITQIIGYDLVNIVTSISNGTYSDPNFAPIFF